jgi:hypothetical protein
MVYPKSSLTITVTSFCYFYGSTSTGNPGRISSRSYYSTFGNTIIPPSLEDTMLVKWHQNEVILSAAAAEIRPAHRDDLEPRLRSLVNGSANQTSRFLRNFDNQECVTFHMVLAISRGGLGWIWRFGILSMSIATCTSETIQVYT